MTKDAYNVKSYDIPIYPHSASLYCVEDKTAELNIFGKEDEKSVFKVVMDVIDGINHLIFHIYQCDLRLLRISDTVELYVLILIFD